MSVLAARQTAGATGRSSAGAQMLPESSGTLAVVSEATVRRLVGFADVLGAVEAAFLALHRDQSLLLPIALSSIGMSGHSFGIKAGHEASRDLLGVKAGSYCFGNEARGLPAHTSTVLLVDPSTGAARAIVAANYLNGLRTAAADALAVRHLARADAACLGLIGTGQQALCEVAAILHVRPIKRIVAAARSATNFEAFRARVRETHAIDVERHEIVELLALADIVVTTTPSTEPLVMAADVRPGTHVSAMGADMPGKQELEASLARRSRWFVDDVAQAVRCGETQHPYSAGLLAATQLNASTLGALVAGEAVGRRDHDDITVFDSSGTAVQDLAAAGLALDLALAAGEALFVPF